MKTKLLFVLAVILGVTTAYAEPLELSNKPLAVEAEGVNPNIMMIVDESGSMTDGNSNDVFYAPGYDANIEYKCSNTSRTILEPNNSSTVVVYMSLKTKSGFPYFKYGSSFYTWNNTAYTKLDDNTMSGAACFDPTEIYKVKLQADTKSGSNYYYANGSTEEFDGNFLNWYFSATKSEWSDNSLTGGYSKYSGELWTQSHATTFNTGSTDRGLKSGVSYKTQRLKTAKDVAKKVVRDMDKANFGLVGYTTSSWAPTIFLHHGLVELDIAKDKTATESSKKSLLSEIDDITSDAGTPTGLAVMQTVRYLFSGWGTESFYYKDSETKNKSISDIYSWTKTTDSTSAPSESIATSTNKKITDDKWCQKHALAILTDGYPTADYHSNLFADYVPKNVNTTAFNSLATAQVNEGSNVPLSRKHLVRLLGGLYDHDFLPEMEGRQNITSYMIGFGEENIKTDPAMILAGQAGGGEYYVANSGAEIAQAFKDIVEKISAKAMSVTAIAVSTVTEDKFDSYAIQANYETEYWSGELKAYRLNDEGFFVQPDGTGDGTRRASEVNPKWKANEVMHSEYLINKPANEVRKRQVYTYNGSSGLRFGSDTMSATSDQTSGFVNLPQILKDDLNRSARNASQRYDLMMYLLGDVSNEMSFNTESATRKYKSRGEYTVSNGKVSEVTKGGMIGDITNSSPVYVKEPSRPWDDKNYGEDGKRYSQFHASNKDRAAMIYVGTNRGFVHGFTIESGSKNGRNYPAGSELFAYMPMSIATTEAGHGYAYLADKNYDHQFYIDAKLTQSDVFMDFYGTGLEWRSILVGGLRGGGKGLFALDVTCPYQTAGTGSTCDNESFNEQNILWEFTSTNDSDLGYTYGEPVIAKVNYNVEGNSRNGNGKGRWAAIVSNGYNSTNGKAALFIIFLDGGLDGTWTEGKDYLKIIATDTNNTNPNGLSSATAVDIDNDGMVDRIYAGDLKGQMWVFDVNQAVSYQE